MIYITQERLAVLLRSIAHLSDEETSGIVSAATREAAQAEVSAHSARLEYQAAELATLRGELSAAQHSADSAHAACMGWKDEARRLRAVLAQHAERQGECRCAPPQREPVQPLSDEQISNVVSTFDGCADWNLHDFARAIERLITERMSAAKETKCDGMPASKDERYLRRLLAYRVDMPSAYYDDGEAQGQESGISIDFMREPVSDIDAKLRALNVARSMSAQTKEHGS